MTETPSPEPKKPNLGLRAAVDYAGPLAFLVGYFATHDFLKATWFLVAASAAALVAGFALERRVAPMPLITGGAALFFGLLTLVFHDPAFVKMKPTAINLGLAAALLVGLKLGKNPLKFLMGEALHLSDAGWRKLTFRYGIFFACVAVLNELVWRTQPDATWVVFRMPGLPLLALAFSMTQVPSMLKDAKALEIALKASETQD
jgi:intracellular septation protein